MSTKIPNGFRLAEGTDLDSFKSKVRDVIDPLRDQEDIKLLAIETAKLVDSRWLAGDPILPGAAAAAYAQWAEAQSKMSVYDYDHDLNRFELSIGTDPETDVVVVTDEPEGDVADAVPAEDDGGPPTEAVETVTITTERVEDPDRPSPPDPDEPPRRGFFGRKH